MRCIRSSIWDVAVGIRKGSSTYAQWSAEPLSAENGRQLFAPAGFADEFVTLRPDTEVLYKVPDLRARLLRRDRLGRYGYWFVLAPSRSRSAALGERRPHAKTRRFRQPGRL